MAAIEQRPVSFIDESAGIEFGEDVAPAPASEDRTSFVIASYNIRYAVGRYLISSGLMRRVGLNPPQPRAGRVARNIRIAAQAFTETSLLPAPDILALQEADKETARSGRQHIARELAQILEMNWVHVSAGIPRGVAPRKRQWWLDFEEQIGLDDAGDTGVALLSRLPLEDVKRIDLPWHECAWRPRLGLGANALVGRECVRLFNAHIDPHASLDGQHDQLETILELAEKDVGPTVILGDFNTLSHKKAMETRRLMEARGFLTPFLTSTATWRGAGLRLHADWIFVRDLRVKRSGVARPLNVSDHWPIWAELAW